MTPTSRLSLALDVAEELEKVRRMPPHVPGVVNVISLDDLPEYLLIHGLKMTGVSAEGVLIVEKE